MMSPFLNEIAQEKMRRALAAAEVHRVPTGPIRIGFSGWIRWLAARRWSVRTPIARRRTPVPVGDAAYNA